MPRNFVFVQDRTQRPGLINKYTRLLFLHTYFIAKILIVTPLASDSRIVALLSTKSMDSFTSFFYGQQSLNSNRWSSGAFKNFQQISVTVQNHLKKVYLALCCALVASAVGAYVHILWNIGGFLTTLGSVGCIIWLFSTPTYEEKRRVSLLLAAASLQGASLGPLIDIAINFDPSILVSAFVGCALAFGCFSAAAMLARRREYLYLGGLLSSGISILLWLHFASSVFGGSMALFKFEIYFGLLLFVGYIIVDTQDIIERAHLGDLDYVKHALTLFTDFAAVFVRLLIIMLKNASDKEEKKRRKRN